jgi:MerR family transcriptional regulator, thiopeptide resistance regulator
MERQYRVGEFAELTGVSVRTLHHYDQIGLLHPSDHSEGGHRLYSEEELLCLQQILTLRYLGFGLDQIRTLLRRSDFDLVASLRIQRHALADRISELERIKASLAELLEQRLTSGQWDWKLALQASTTVQDGLTQKGDRMEPYYTPEQMKQFEELREEFPEEDRLRIEQDWTALLAEVRANRQLDPASPEAQALADRWDRLREETMRGYQNKPELLAAIAKNYQENRFAGNDRAPQPEDIAFFQKVNELRGR